MIILQYASKNNLIATIISFLIYFFTSNSAFAYGSYTNDQYHKQISQLWNQKKAQYVEIIRKSGDQPYNLYNIQAETNNLLKYAGYCKKYAILDELTSLYLQALDSLTITDKYVFYYYPENQRKSVRQLDKKVRMWVNKQQNNGDESILVSSQFLYLLSDTISIIVNIKKEQRTPVMEDALHKFVPILLEHYNRWILDTPGPFQVRGWGCRADGKYVPTGMNHFEFLNKKLEYKLGNGKSPAYCNAVTDTDLWIIAGVANLLTIYKKDKNLVPMTQVNYEKLLNYTKTGVTLLESRFSYTHLKNFKGKTVTGAILEPGAWDGHNREFAGYHGNEYPKEEYKITYKAKGVGWDLNHACRFVHVLESLVKSKDVLGLNFPTRDFMGKMANQLSYATFNRDFRKPLFTNFMDGTNGWYRVGYENRQGFGYGPWDMSIAVLTGGYGFWSKYSPDARSIMIAIIDMLQSHDADIRKHVTEHYEINHWNKYKRISSFDFRKQDDQKTQSILMQFLPSLCFIYQ